MFIEERKVVQKEKRMKLMCSAKQARDYGLREMERGLLIPESTPFLILAPVKAKKLPALEIHELSPYLSNLSLFFFRKHERIYSLW